MNQSRQFRYVAFISYCSADAKWAKWIQKSIEYYRIPSFIRKNDPSLNRRIGKVFLDTTDLNGSHLQSPIHNAMDQSKWLIVVCSPHAVMSDWVNDEVLHFIETGKGDRIIPVIVSGRPYANDPVDECFPEAIRVMKGTDNELLGISVDKSGKKQASVKIISTILGITFDTLWQRHVRRRKTQIGIISGIAALLVTLVFLLCAYTHTRKEYYADFSEEWGLPSGITPLSKEQVKHRECSFEFDYKRIPIGEPEALTWRISRIKLVNSSGRTVQHPDPESLRQYSVIEYDYSHKSGALIRTTIIDEKSHILMRSRFKSKDGSPAMIADFENPIDELGEGYISSNSTAKIKEGRQRRRGCISRLLFIRDESGRITRETYHSNNDINTDASLTHDVNGHFGQSFIYDSLGRIISIEYLAKNLAAYDNPKSIGSASIHYDIWGNIISMEFFNKKGERVANKDGWSIRRLETDNYGNITDVRYYDRQEAPYMTKEGHWFKRSHDDRGFLVCKYFLDTQGMPYIPKKKGYAKQIFFNNSRGLAVRNEFFDDKEAPVMSYDKVFAQESEYNKYGSRTRIKFFDTENQPCISSYKCHEMVSTYNRENLISRVDFYDVYGKHCKSKYGIATSLHEYEKGNLIREYYLDENGEPCLDSKGSADIRFTYDERGTRTSVEYRDINGVVAPDASGVARRVWVINADGDRLSESTYDADGALHISKKGVAFTYWQYNAYGDVIEETYADADGNPCENSDGIAKCVYEYNEQGEESNRIYYDLNGNITDDPILATLKRLSALLDQLHK